MRNRYVPTCAFSYSIEQVLDHSLLIENLRVKFTELLELSIILLSDPKLSSTRPVSTMPKISDFKDGELTISLPCLSISHPHFEQVHPPHMACLIEVGFRNVGIFSLHLGQLTDNLNINLYSPKHRIISDFGTKVYRNHYLYSPLTDELTCRAGSA